MRYTKENFYAEHQKTAVPDAFFTSAFLSHQQKLAEKRLYFILTAIHRHLRLFVTPA